MCRVQQWHQVATGHDLQLETHVICDRTTQGKGSSLEAVRHTLRQRHARHWLTGHCASIVHHQLRACSTSRLSE